jgi:tRNA(adenine34) deaminase
MIRGLKAPSFMDLALKTAENAGKAGEVPIGCVVVRNYEVIATAANRTLTDYDPTAHAEIVALREAAATLGHWRVEGTLVVTHEPCPMCAGALVNARVARLVFGCPNPKAGAVATLYQIVSDPRLNHRVAVTSGVRAAECAAVLQAFFAELRQGPSYQ